MLQVQTATDRYVLLVATFKPSIGTFCLELPNGPMAANETAQDAAKRILKEMTGYTSTAPAGGAISPWLPVHADLCPDIAKMVELVVIQKKAKPNKVVSIFTKVRIPQLWQPRLIP